MADGKCAHCPHCNFLEARARRLEALKTALAFHKEAGYDFGPEDVFNSAIFLAGTSGVDVE